MLAHVSVSIRKLDLVVVLTQDIRASLSNPETMGIKSDISLIRLGKKSSERVKQEMKKFA